jgi:NTP pyrophosphatase (non-canonical NTP hydrolase)
MPLSLAESCEQIQAIAKSANENAWNKGFHSAGQSTDDKFPRWCMLIVSEIAEAMEAHRCQEGQDRIAEELADAVIRIVDTAYAMGLNIGNAVHSKMTVNAHRPKMHGSKLY